MEVVLIEGDADQRMIYLGNDVVSVLEAVDGHGRCAAELDGQLDAHRISDSGLLYGILNVFRTSRSAAKNFFLLFFAALLLFF